MISSPCKDCPRLAQPKSECALACEKINKIQEFQLRDSEKSFSNEFDVCTEAAFAINPYIYTS